MTIIPIKDLQDTNKISKMAHESMQPIFVTKNGYGDLVIMSQEAYQRTIARQYIDDKLAKSEEDVKNNAKLIDGEEFFDKMRDKYGF